LLPDHINLGGISMRTLDQPHGTITSAGLRFDAGGKTIIYSTDFHDLTPQMEFTYQGADLWIVDALRRRPHPTHPHLDQAVEWARQLRVTRTVLTHMDNSMDYDTLAAELPAGVEPGYDGQEIAL
jgi:phosphoribosyl 1,2-cyclic phosphate phosphodiesterase